MNHTFMPISEPFFLFFGSFFFDFSDWIISKSGKSRFTLAVFEEKGRVGPSGLGWHHVPVREHWLRLKFFLDVMQSTNLEVWDWLLQHTDVSRALVPRNCIGVIGISFIEKMDPLLKIKTFRFFKHHCILFNLIIYLLF